MVNPGKLIFFLDAVLDRTRKTLNEVFYGMTAYELELEMKKEKGSLNTLLMLMVFGDMIGVPLFPPYYSMRLLPFVVPHITTWKRNIHREKDLTDIIAGDI
ncbi:MAG: hypothetical protein ABFD82_20580 [Syntrophaceae bacterium]